MYKVSFSTLFGTQCLDGSYYLLNASYHAVIRDGNQGMALALKSKHNSDLIGRKYLSHQEKSQESKSKDYYSYIIYRIIFSPSDRSLAECQAVLIDCLMQITYCGTNTMFWIPLSFSGC